jgi:o-succinylbenzoate---CoA ligase
VISPTQCDRALSVSAAADEHPTRRALVLGDHVYSYAALRERVATAKAAIESKLEGHARERGVALVADMSLATFVAFYALLELGVPLIALHPKLTARERRELLAEAGADLVLDSNELSAPLAAATPCGALDPEGAAAIVFTSGTTGRPKGAILSRRAFVVSALASATNLPCSAADRWLLLLPLAHVGGLSILTRCLLARACVVVDVPGVALSPERLQMLLETQRITLVSLVPTLLQRLLDLESTWRPPATLRAVLLGGAAASSKLIERSAARGVPVLTTYGFTEGCSQVTTQTFGTQPDTTHGAGRPLPGVELRIVANEIQVRSSTLLSHYLTQGIRRDPRLPGGWFATGDHGYLDAQGRLHLLNRRTDLIVTGGENVYPVEVEHCLEQIPGIAQACVFGVEDEHWGQVVCAALVREPRAALDTSAIAPFLETQLAVFKRPRRFAWLARLSTTEAGKLDRRAVRAACLGSLSSRPASL